MSHPARRERLERLIRTAPCERCLKAGRPEKTTLWISYDEASIPQLNLHVGTTSIMTGVTPHLFELTPSSGRNWTSQRRCLVLGCAFMIEIVDVKRTTFDWRPVTLEGTAVEELLSSDRMKRLRRYSETGFELSSVDMQDWKFMEMLSEFIIKGAEKLA